MGTLSMTYVHTESCAENSICDHCAGAMTEKLVMAVRRLAPATLHIVMFQQCPLCVQQQGQTLSGVTLAPARILDRQLQVAAHHGTAAVDMLAVCPGKHCLWALPNNRLEFQVHPGWMTHQYVADVVVFSFRKAIEESTRGCQANGDTANEEQTRETVSPKELLARVPVCFVPASRFSAFDRNASSTLKNTSSGWALVEERGGKPGWIAHDPGATMSFTLKFGDRPTITIS